MGLRKLLKREFLDSILSMKLNQGLMVLVNFFMAKLLAMVKKLNSVTSALAIFSQRYFQSPPSILLMTVSMLCLLNVQPNLELSSLQRKHPRNNTSNWLLMVRDWKSDLTPFSSEIESLDFVET